jgi:MerR family redox-sensitive transcriptional activator SoxR
VRHIPVEHGREDAAEGRGQSQTVPDGDRTGDARDSDSAASAGNAAGDAADDSAREDVAAGPDRLLAVGEVSRRTGVAVSALHYYERIGLIHAERTAGNQRRYPRHMIRRISIVSVARRLGIPLSDVADALRDVPMDRPPTEADWRRASTRWKAALEARRMELERLENALVGCIGCGCLSMRACRLLNPDDRLGAAGPGPHRLLGDVG